MRTTSMPGWLAILLLLSAPICRSQASAPASPTQVPATSSAPPADYSKEPYVFELIETEVRFEADGKGQRDLSLRVRIQSESAVHEFGLLTYAFASRFETLDVIFVRVRKPDGTVLETPLSDVQEIDSAVSREAPMYTDQREKHIAVKSLAVGDTLEAHIRWTTTEPLAPGHFWYADSYFRAGICLRETIKFDLPAGLPVKLRNSDPQPTIQEAGGRHIYTFTHSNLKHAEESKIPDWEKNPNGAPLPDVELSSFTSWAEVGAWYNSLQQPKVVVTPDIRAKAEELTKGRTSDEEKLRAIYDFVSTRFRYIGVDLGLSRYTPHAAADVFANRYGDCKDKHTLFAALLQAAGINVYPALISSSFQIDPAFPSPSAFDHVITAVPRGDSFLFLDTTPEVAPYGMLLRNLRDRQALVMPGSAPARLVTTPADLPIPNYEHAKIEASIDINGTLDAKMRFEDRGDSEVLLRLAYRGTPENQWQELTQKIMAGMGFAGTVSDVSVAEPEDTSQPFWLSFSYHRTDYPDWKDHRVILPAPAALLFSLNEEQKLSKEPLPLGSPREITYDATLKFPEGFIPLLPKKVEEKSDFAEYSATYALEDGSLHGTLRLRTLVHELPGSERSQFSSLSKIVDESSRKYILVVGDSASTTNAPKGTIVGKTDTPVLNSSDLAARPSSVSPAKSLYDSGKRAETNREYAASAQLYEQAVAKDPTYADAWNSLGLTYNNLKRYDKAEDAFRKALALDPGIRFAHHNLGLALQNQRKFEESIEEYKKEIELNPENARSHQNLGYVYVHIGQFENAIPFLEAAAKRMPDNPAVQFNLGLAYAKTGQPEKAVRAFNRSVELEPTAERQNSVAYQMALDKLQLDQAQQYVEASILHTVDQTKDISLEHLSNEDASVSSLLGADWDTLGWVKFQQGNTSDAEKYVLSAWQLRSIGEIGDHLAQIYEKENRKDDAVQLYAMALASPDPMAETRSRLVVLLGSDSDVDRLTEEARVRIAQTHSITLKNPRGADGAADFWILLISGLRVAEVKFISGDESLRPYVSDLQTATFPETFPDATEVKILRRGKLTCSHSTAQCSFILMSSETVRSAN